MGYPVDFTGTNQTLLGGRPDVADMRVFNNGVCNVSCWELSEAELAAVAKSGRVYISVLSGESSPPVFVGSQATVRALVADYGSGPWKEQRRNDEPELPLRKHERLDPEGGIPGRS
jgi:hypothetical protein